MLYDSGVFPVKTLCQFNSTAYFTSVCSQWLCVIPGRVRLQCQPLWQWCIVSHMDTVESVQCVVSGISPTPWECHQWGAEGVQQVKQKRLITPHSSTHTHTHTHKLELCQLLCLFFLSFLSTSYIFAFFLSSITIVFSLMPSGILAVETILLVLQVQF